MHAGARTCLVDHIDCLVRKIAVLDIADRELHRCLERLVRIVDVVVLLVAGLQSLQDLERVLRRRLAHEDRLEAALEGGILLDVLAVLVDRRGTDDLDLATGQRRLQDRGGIDGALSGAGTDEGMDLVDEEDVLLRLLDLVDDLLQAVLELATVLGACDERCDIERPDLLVAQDIRHVACADELRQAFGDSGLADTRVAQDHRVVLLAACEHLHDALDLAVAADDRIELAISGKLREVAAVLLEKRAFLLLCASSEELRPDAYACSFCSLLRLRLCVLHELVHGIPHGIP